MEREVDQNTERSQGRRAHLAHPRAADDDVELDRRFGPRREHRRVDIQLWTEGSSGGRLDFHTSTNLSEGGIYIETPTPYVEGSEAMLAFLLPRSPREIKVRARAVNLVSDDNEAPASIPPERPSFGNGFQFLDLEPGDRALIRAFISSAPR